MPVVWSDRHRLHDPGGEVWVGVRTPGTEVPERAERIREALAADGARFVEAEEQPDDAVLAVHDAALVDYLATAWDEWEASGLTEDPGQDRVVPYLFPHPGLVEAPRTPTATSARAGRFAYDTMTLIGPGTWEAARAAVDTAVTAADLVLAGAPAAYALCRPPGHHVTRTAFGGSCYLNNTAAAAARLHEGTGEGTVAILDVDAHHGNGTQSIFWNEPYLPTGSVHVDPGAGWFPHYVGFADETAGANRNLPLPPGSGDDAWLAGVRELRQWAGEADFLVVALGVDAAGGDPESPLEVTADGFRRAGRILGGMGLPTVVVQEGGYDLDRIGGLVLEVLAGIEEGAHG
jgi:acetoin utilization deacetylase AcuC-like enzyme